MFVKFCTEKKEPNIYQLMMPLMLVPALCCVGHVVDMVD